MLDVLLCNVAELIIFSGVILMPKDMNDQSLAERVREHCEAGIREDCRTGAVAIGFGNTVQVLLVVEEVAGLLKDRLPPKERTVHGNKTAEVPSFGDTVGIAVRNVAMTCFFAADAQTSTRSTAESVIANALRFAGSKERVDILVSSYPNVAALFRYDSKIPYDAGLLATEAFSKAVLWTEACSFFAENDSVIP